MRIGVFVGLGGFFLALVQPRDSAEFVVSVCSAAIGLTLVALIVFLSAIMKRL